MTVLPTCGSVASPKSHVYVKLSFPGSVALALNVAVSPSLILVSPVISVITGAVLLTVTTKVSVVIAPSLSVIVKVTL